MTSLLASCCACLLACVLSAASVAAAAATHCNADEVDYFSCRIRGSAKIVSLCGSGSLLDEAADRNADRWLQYRYGPPGKPELVHPQVKAGSLKAFTAERSAPFDDKDVRREVNTLWFKRESATYGIEVRDARTPFFGVWVGTARKNVELRCEGSASRWLADEGRRFVRLVGIVERGN